MLYQSSRITGNLLLISARIILKFILTSLAFLFKFLLLFAVTHLIALARTLNTHLSHAFTL